MALVGKVVALVGSKLVAARAEAAVVNSNSSYIPLPKGWYNRRVKKFFLLILLLGGLGFLTWLFWTNKVSLPSRESTVSSVAAAPSPELLVIEPTDLVEEYRNDVYKFSLRLPENFKATEVGEGTIVLQNIRGEGIQIVISPFDEDLTILTNERVLMDVQDLSNIHLRTL